MISFAKNIAEQQQIQYFDFHSLYQHYFEFQSLIYSQSYTYYDFSLLKWCFFTYDHIRFLQTVFVCQIDIPFITKTIVHIYIQCEINANDKLYIYRYHIYISLRPAIFFIAIHRKLVKFIHKIPRIGNTFRAKVNVSNTQISN